MGLLQSNGRVNSDKPKNKPNLKASIKLEKLKPSIRRPSNPKKLIKPLYILLLVVLVGATVFYYFDNRNDSKSVSTKKAEPCAFFNLSDAKKVLGNSAQKGGVQPLTQTSTKDREVSSCVYTQKLKPNSVTKSASVAVLKPKTDLGKAYNSYAFEGGKPVGVQDLSGYGQSAYWEPRFGTLNVLKNGKWIFLSSGTASSITERNLDDAKKLADIVISKL